MTVSNPGATHERTFTYDNDGNLTSISAPSTPWADRVYGYDALDRLTHAEGYWGTTDYTYDDVGNRLTKTEEGATDTYAYVAGTNIIDTVTNGASIIYTHDLNGNVTGIGNKELFYNQNNRLIRVEQDSVVLGEYTYNGLGQRIVKEAGGVITIFLYDFDGNIIGESATDSIFSKEYLYYYTNRLAMVDVGSGEIYTYGNDSLGTPEILLDSTNTVVWEGKYKPFGEVEVNPNSMVENNFRFPGQYYDQETGLHYNGFRYYEPKTGRYLRPDPIGQIGNLNIFLYAMNNSINKMDSKGLFVAEAAIGMSASAVAATEAAAVVVSGTAVAVVGVGSYYLTSRAIEDTWLGRGGIGLLIYNVTHLSIESINYVDYEREKRKYKTKNTQIEIKYGGPCEEPPSPPDDECERLAKSIQSPEFKKLPVAIQAISIFMYTFGCK